MQIGCDRDTLFTQYRYLCKRGSRKFFRGTVERSDLEQTAAIGLLKACDRFEPTSGTPFEAYAWLMVVGELMHYVRDHERLVRLPRSLRRLDAQYGSVRHALVARDGREPHVTEIARAMDVSVSVVDEVRLLHTNALVVALDAAPSPTEPHVEGLPARAFSDEGFIVREAMASLDADERRVVHGTYVAGLTQREVGEAMGVPQRQVSRILARARKKLADALG